MKKFLKITALLLCFIFIALPLASCIKKTGKTLLSCEGQSISVNVYKLYLSRIRATLSSHGYDVSSESFWNTVVDLNSKTLDEYYLDIVLEETKRSLAVLCLFEKLQKEGKVKFTDEHREEIDERVNELMEYDADGSKTEFNKILAEYGANIDVLKFAYETEVKKELLVAYYYGTNGSQIAEEVKEAYLKENYLAFKQILIAKFYYVYETDKNGDDIYFNDVGKIAYDKVNGKPKYDELGEPEYDSDRNIIYYLDDGRIAYDKETGKRKNKLNSDGSVVVKEYTAEELGKNYELVEQIVEELKDGDTAGFEENVYKYAEYANSTPSALEGTYYFKSNETSSYEYVNKMTDAIKTIEVGDIIVVDTDYGYHIIMRYELEKGAYSKDENKAYFDSFISDLTNKLLRSHTDEYISKIEVDEKLLEEISMKDIGNNFYY